MIPIADVAPLYLGIKKGFFEEEKLTIEPQLAEGGAAIIPSVMSGDYQIGFSNAVSLLIAASKDLPVQIISQGVLGGTTQDDAWDAVVLPKGSRRQDGQGPRGQDDRGQHAQQHRPGHDQQRAGEERRRLQEGQVRRGAVPGDGRGARGQARRRGVHGRAGVLRRGGGRRHAALQLLRRDGAEPHRRHVLRVQAVHRREQGDRRALPAGDDQVAGVRGDRTTKRCARSSASTRRSRPR